ncbi:MAG: TetR/AcrR family transcriptional regulator [Terracidiphilus sp.]
MCCLVGCLRALSEIRPPTTILKANYLFQIIGSQDPVEWFVKQVAILLYSLGLRDMAAGRVKDYLDDRPTNWYVGYRPDGIRMTLAETRHESKTRFLQAALRVIRVKGYTATRVEDICETAGLTKGSFFHHFDSKEELAVAATDYWMERTDALFASAPYHMPADPLQRLLAYLDFRKALLTGELPDFTCLAGTMVQEIYDTHPTIREVCNRSISGHAETLEPDIAEAMRKYGATGAWTPRSLALHIQAVLQGSFILAKAKGGPAVAVECIDHLRRYIEMLFQQRESKACLDL